MGGERSAWMKATHENHVLLELQRMLAEDMHWCKVHKQDDDERETADTVARTHEAQVPYSDPHRDVYRWGSTHRELDLYPFLRSCTCLPVDEYSLRREYRRSCAIG